MDIVGLSVCWVCSKGCVFVVFYSDMEGTSEPFLLEYFVKIGSLLSAI